MSDQVTYRVARGTIRLPKQAGDLPQGVIVPPGALDKADMGRMVRDGVIEAFELDVPAPAGSNEPVPSHGKWDRDPASLEGLSLEEMLVAVHEIDPKYPLADLDEAAARKLLSSQFQPVFQEPVAKASADEIADAARRAAAEHGDQAASEV